MKLSIAICTKNNLQRIGTCIESIRNQTIMPFELLVVDASTESKTQEYISTLSTIVSFSCVYIKQVYGYLTHARNIAIKRMKGDAILFLDDDVILDKTYLENIISVLDRDKEGFIGGVQGLITNQIKIPYFLTLMKYLFLLDSPRRGIILLETGCNTYPGNVTRISSVMWLSGSNMCFRKRVVDEFYFNEEISCSYDVSGYRFVGEDVEYSYRVGQRYHLFIIPKAKLLHMTNLSKVERPALRFSLPQLFHSKRYWIDNYSNWTLFREIIFLWSFIGRFVISVVTILAIRIGEISR